MQLLSHPRFSLIAVKFPAATRQNSASHVIMIQYISTPILRLGILILFFLSAQLGSAEETAATILKFTGVEPTRDAKEVTVGDYVFVSDQVTNDKIASRPLVVTDHNGARVLAPRGWGMRIEMRRVDGAPFELVSFEHGFLKGSASDLDLQIFAYGTDGDPLGSPLLTLDGAPQASVPVNRVSLSKCVFDWSSGANPKHGFIDNIAVLP